MALWHKCVAVIVTGCGFDPLSRKCNNYLNLYIFILGLMSGQSAALCFSTQYAMPPEFGGMWGTKCLNIRFPLSIQL